ncbi:MAG: hypothetical protein EA426_17705 [Spirochaetaceae bacterium]|nr:MAG: hypothetical protein EA426_17705 [Spirochaetaceae bacterium]
MKKLVFGIAVFAAWAAFTVNRTVPALAIGLGLSAIGVLVFGSLLDGRTWIGRSDAITAAGPQRRGRLLVRMMWLVVFIPVFIGKVIWSGVTLAFLALKPNMDFWPGIVRVDGGLTSITATTVFAGLITLTPGTLTMDYDEENDNLYVHWIDVTGYGDVAFDDRVTGGLRQWVRRISE